MDHEVEAVVASERKVLDASPKKEDWVGTFGRDGLVEHEDGTWEYHYKRPDLTAYENERRAKLAEGLYAGKVEASIEASYERESRTETVPVRRADGMVDMIPAKHEDAVARKGRALPVIRWGRRRTRYRASDLMNLPSKPLKSAAEIRGW